MREPRPTVIGRGFFFFTIAFDCITLELRSYIALTSFTAESPGGSMNATLTSRKVPRPVPAQAGHGCINTQLGKDVPKLFINDPALHPRRREQLERHVERCPICKAEAEDFYGVRI